MIDGVTLVSGGDLWLGGPHGTVIEDGAVAFRGDQVAWLGPESERPSGEPAERLDARGGLIAPGLVNLHHHFYSALARGMDPGRPLSNFTEILEGLWWRLDRALDVETVRLSAQLSLAESIRAGCTTVFDHHASPAALAGSLDIIAAESLAAGLRVALSYEVSDRNGHAEALAGIAENERFAAAVKGEPRLHGMMGLHASFTVSDATLRAAAKSGLGAHVHVAEDLSDVSRSRAEFGADPVTRLVDAGFANESSLFAHGVHLDAAALDKVAQSGATLVHNPESNANNAVGWLDLGRAAGAGLRLGLGTDGMSSSMLGALRASFLLERAQWRDPTLGFGVHTGLLSHNAHFAAMIFDRPWLGQLAVGGPADLIVIDAPTPTPISSANVFGHLIYGASRAPVRHTVAGGKTLMENFELLHLDLAALAARAKQAAAPLWRRFAQLGEVEPREK